MAGGDIRVNADVMTNTATEFGTQKGNMELEQSKVKSSLEAITTGINDFNSALANHSEAVDSFNTALNNAKEMVVPTWDGDSQAAFLGLQSILNKSMNDLSDCFQTLSSDMASVNSKVAEIIGKIDNNMNILQEVCGKVQTSLNTYAENVEANDKSLANALGG